MRVLGGRCDCPFTCSSPAPDAESDTAAGALRRVPDRADQRDLGIENGMSGQMVMGRARQGASYEIWSRDKDGLHRRRGPTNHFGHLSLDAALDDVLGGKPSWFRMRGNLPHSIYCLPIGEADRRWREGAATVSMTSWRGPSIRTSTSTMSIVFRGVRNQAVSGTPAFSRSGFTMTIGVPLRHSVVPRGPWYACCRVLAGQRRA